MFIEAAEPFEEEITIAADGQESVVLSPGREAVQLVTSITIYSNDQYNASVRKTKNGKSFYHEYAGKTTSGVYEPVSGSLADILFVDRGAKPIVRIYEPNSQEITVYVRYYVSYLVEGQL
jgi:hypothetical protein